MRAVVLQSAIQVRHYSEHKRQEGDLIIPIGPEAMYCAEKQGWNTCNLGELWSSQDYERAKDESQARIDGLLSALNAYSRNWNSNFELEMGNYYAFQLWGIIGQLHYNHFIARSISERIQPDSLLIYTKAVAQISSDLNLADPDCIFADMAANSGCFKIASIEIQKIDRKSRANTIKEQIRNSLPEKLLMQLRISRSRWQIRNLKSSAYRLLMVGGGYDWLKIARYEAFRDTFSIRVIPHLVAEKKNTPPKELVGILNSSIESAERPVYDMEILAATIYADMVLYAEKYEEIKNKLKQYDALVTAVLTSPWENYLSHMATKMSIPVVVWQHGEKGQSYDVTTLYTELFYATDYLSYGASVSDQYRLWIDKLRLINVETVGSLGKRVAWSDGTSIVYVTGKWFTTSVPFSVLPDPDSRLYRAHKTILNYLDTKAAKHPIIFKANNTPGANTIPYEYTHIRIDYSTPFTELLKTAGVIILDTPATTLVESCSTNVPIFALGGRTEYLPDFLNKIKRRVVWCDTPEELVLKLDSYLHTGKYGADINDNTYSREYCATLDPDEVILRVKESLIDAIGRYGNVDKR